MNPQLDNRRIRATLTALFGAAAVSTLCTMTMTACRTTEGVGEDIEEVGDEISDEAREHDGD